MSIRCEYIGTWNSKVWHVLMQVYCSRYCTRWAPTNYKRTYKPYKWPYKWVTAVITPINGVINLVITGRGPPCRAPYSACGGTPVQWKLNASVASAYKGTKKTHHVNCSSVLPSVTDRQCCKKKACGLGCLASVFFWPAASEFWSNWSWDSNFQ